MMITEIGDFFSKGCGRCARFDTPECSTRRWSGGLRELRRICREAGLTETVKWGHPCYTHAGRNIAIIGAFREDFRLNFMNASLLKDTEALLEKQGPNARHPDMIRFTDEAHVAKRKLAILAYLKEAMGYVEAGIKPAKVVQALVLPDELVDAMDADPELAEAFDNLTPGRQRSYVINLQAAKSSTTRVSRIAKFRTKILAGKGATEQ